MPSWHFVSSGQYNLVHKQQKGKNQFTFSQTKSFTYFQQQVNKLPFQRIQYRSFEGTPTYSALELFPHCPLLQEIYQNPAPFTNVVTVSCEITIFHIYHKNLQQRITLQDMTTTVSPNILGWDGTRGKKNGDPDNSALTGASSYSYKNGNLIFLLTISLNSYLLYNIPNRFFAL